MTFHVLGTIFPTDELILFKGIETTNQIIITIIYIYIIIVVIIASIIVHFYFCVIIIMITELVCFIS